MREQLWTVARYPNGTLDTGGKPNDPAYTHAEVFQVLATSRENAKKKAQAQRSRAQRTAAQKEQR